MKKAWKLFKVIHTFCVAHGIHNLLMKDCLPRLIIVPDLLDKIQKTIYKLRYRQQRWDRFGLKPNRTEINRTEIGSVRNF